MAFRNKDHIVIYLYSFLKQYINVIDLFVPWE